MDDRKRPTRSPKQSGHAPARLRSEPLVTVYYAGLDVHALPFGEARKRISQRGTRAVLYAKLLALFADDVVIPPTFYFDAIQHETIRESVRASLSPLYAAGLLRSPVHVGLSSTADFLYLKLEDTAVSKAIPSPAELVALTQFFSEIPVSHRDVTTQSRGFRDRVFSSLPDAGLQEKVRSSLRRSLITREGRGGVALSRRHALAAIRSLQRRGTLRKQDVRNAHYAISRSYYLQACDTYGSVVALPGVSRYSILGRHAFEDATRGIAVGYDPEVLEVLLNAYGIGLNVIQALSLDDLQAIKRSGEYWKFRRTFYRFVCKIQDAAVASNGVSARFLETVKQRVMTEFHAEYVLGNRILDERRYRWGIAETTSWAALFGALGFFITPLLGLLLGAIPVVLQVSRVTPRLSDYVLGRLDRGQAAFHHYVEFLGSVVRHLET